nr:M14 metallopeptidase family protein [Allomuricauda sp.]
MEQYQNFKEKSVQGRYVTMESLAKEWLPKHDSLHWDTIGASVDGEKILGLKIGNGPTKVLMWSQMHGNESTTTKALLDFVNYLVSGETHARHLLQNCTLMMVPILNPDGAIAYTRVNANQVDLNRDAKDRSQPESRALRKLFDSFKPHYCFNLHGQRTLFSAGSVAKPATVSFLSPARDPERSVNVTRKLAMQLIVAMNQRLQQYIPGQVGRYDDGFNDNCVGDSFQMLDVPTILFEAGHYPNDYEREQTRYYIFLSLLEAVSVIADNKVEDHPFDAYLEIPENDKLFFDVLILNAHKLQDKIENGEKVGIRFVETLINQKIEFIPEIVEVGKLSGHFGHTTFDASKNTDLERMEEQGLNTLVLNINN